MDGEIIRQGDVVAGRYVVEKRLGLGASGSVWIAEDRQLRRAVALKVMHAERIHDLGAFQSFEAEAQALAQVRSHNVVQVYDFGVHCDIPFIVMELLEGEALDFRIAQRRRLSLTAVVGVVGELAEGLSRLHARRIVHRDVKPANVFLVREACGEVAKLLDFGVCGRYDAPSEQPIAPPGTPRYMSPEHISGHALDASADCWSLAVVAYEMLCGKCPFDGQTLEAVRRRICSGSFELPSTHAVGLAASIDALFARALVPDQKLRLTDPMELAAELRRLLHEEGDPVVRILFVDDEPDFEALMRSRFRRELASHTHELFFARGGEVGLEQVRKHPDIHVVFTDLNMPGMSGLSFLSRLPEVNPLVRVVVLSAYGDMTNIRAAMNGGAFDFLCKPIDFADLELTVKRCVADVTELRRSLASREENGIIRLLLGQSVVDRFINATRTGAPMVERFDAAVLALSFGSASNEAIESATEASIERMAMRLEAVQLAISGQQGLVAELTSDTALVVFRGDSTPGRALDTALALRQRLASASEFGSLSRDFRAGVDTGSIVGGAVPVRGAARVEYLVSGTAVTRARMLRDAARAHEILLATNSPPSAYRHRDRDVRPDLHAIAIDAREAVSALDRVGEDGGSAGTTLRVQPTEYGESR